MTTTERRQIPPPSHFSASLNRSSSHGGRERKDASFGQTLGSGRSPQHVILCFKVNTMRRPPRLTYSPRSLSPHTAHPPLCAASFTSSCDLSLPPSYLQYSTNLPSRLRNMPTSHLVQVGLQTNTVIWLKVGVLKVLKITQAMKQKIGKEEEQKKERMSRGSKQQHERQQSTDRGRKRRKQER